MIDERDRVEDGCFIERASPAHAQRLIDLFVRADVPCFCQYYQFQGDHRQWQNRCANERDLNKSALVSDLSESTLVAWVAVRGSQVVGWLRLRGPSEMHKLYEGRLYRGLPCFSGARDHVLTVSCFLVDPEYRRKRIATRLLRAALDDAPSRGVRYVEALPRGNRDVTDEEQWMGPLAAYEAAGFTVVHDFQPYPVLRLALGAFSSR